MFSAVNVNESLMNAVHAKDYDRVFEYLQRYGAKANVPGSCGRTAIGAAAIVGNVEILQLLIQSCEDVDMFRGSNNVSSPQCDMNADNTPEGMDDLEWEDEFDEDDDDIEKDAVADEDTSIYYYYAKTFERTGAILSSLDGSQKQNQLETRIVEDPNQPDVLHMTPLHYAAACGRVNCMQILLEHGAKVDAVDLEGYTPLHAGARFPEVTNLLIKHGANVNLKTLDRGETALHLSIRKNCFAGAKSLIDAGANINEVDDNIQTPLMYAILHQMDSIALKLIEKGAHVNIQDIEGWNALYYAILDNNLVIAENLLKAYARVITSHYLLHYCIRANLFRMLKMLIDYGSCINVRDNFGLTPMLVAIQYKRVDILEYLFKTMEIKARETIYQPIERWDSELLFAVHSIQSLKEFKMIANVLFNYVKEHCFIVDSKNLPSSGCMIPYCHTPVSRAIMQDKLNIAEYLLKEGMDIDQICCDHVTNHLRAICSMPGALELTKLLIHVGFEFPHINPPYPETWTAERRFFEKEIHELRTRPLSLQALCRIRVRKELMRTLLHSETDREKFFVPYSKYTPFELILDDLEIPLILKRFLYDFYDCDSVMYYFNDNDELNSPDIF